MTNFEKYKDKILKILEVSERENPGIKNGIPVMCDNITCSDCDLNEDEISCVGKFINWLYEDDGADYLPDTSKPKTEEPDGCNGCKYEHKAEDESPCTECSSNYTSKWERRTKKTRQDEFLEMFPNAQIDNSTIRICPHSIDVSCECKAQTLSAYNCVKCCKKYWLQEVY